MNRETFTEGDGTVQLSDRQPVIMWGSAAIGTIIALGHLLTGLGEGQGPAPDSMAWAAVWAVQVVYCLARADRMRREGR